MNQPLVDALEQEIHELTIAITASEGWSHGWLAKGQYFKKMLTLEAELDKAARAYLRNLSHRIGTYVDWAKYQQDVVAVQASETKSLEAYDVNVLFDDDGFGNDEQDQVEAFIKEIYLNGAAIGWLSEQARKAGTPGVGPTTVESPIFTQIQESVDQHMAVLTQWLDKTTAEKVVQSIQESIALGESHDLAVKRLIENIGDLSGVRAEMIAQTEMVRAFALGESTFARNNGGVSKTWTALPGADEGSVETPCLDNDGVTVGIDEDFPSGDSDRPAHPRCRCDVAYNYEPAAMLV